MTRAFRRRCGRSVFRRIRATEPRRVLLRTIYDSNRRFSRRPTMNANMRYTWAQCGTAWQIQSKFYYAHSGFVSRCIVCGQLGSTFVVFLFHSPSLVRSLLFRTATLKANSSFLHHDIAQIEYYINIMIELNTIE